MKTLLSVAVASAVLWLGTSVSAPAQVIVTQSSGSHVHYTVAPVPEEITAYPPSRASYLSARDLDSDGVVETATVVHTPPVVAVPTGSLDRITFVGPSAGNVSVPAPRVLLSDDRKSAVGTINRINITKVRGVDTLLVRVNTSINGPGTYVDLGPVERWPAGTIRLRDVLTASGPTADLGDMTVIVADRAALNTNPEFNIARVYY